MSPPDNFISAVTSECWDLEYQIASTRTRPLLLHEPSLRPELVLVKQILDAVHELNEVGDHRRKPHSNANRKVCGDYGICPVIAQISELLTIHRSVFVV
jgi:hypothetical protein